MCKKDLLFIIYIVASQYTIYAQVIDSIDNTFLLEESGIFELDISSQLISDQTYIDFLSDISKHKLHDYVDRKYISGDSGTFFVRNVLDQDTWFEVEARLVDRIEEYTYQEYIPPCPDNGGEIPGPILDLQIPTESTCSSNPNGEWVTRTAYTKHADKSDGVVNTESVLWSEGDSFNDLNNRYYDDLGDAGGYNHFELRNYERGYDLKRSNGSYVFRKGDPAPQFVFMREWVNDLNN